MTTLCEERVIGGKHSLCHLQNQHSGDGWEVGGGSPPSPHPHQRLDRSQAIYLLADWSGLFNALGVAAVLGPETVFFFPHC